MKGSRPLTPDEAKQLKQFFKGKMAVRNRAMFLLGANTGFRVSELLSLRLGDVLNYDGTVKDRVTVLKRNMKGKKSSRTVLLNEHGRRALVPWLKALKRMSYVHKDDFVFQSRWEGNRAISSVQAWRILTAAYRACGLPGKLGTHAMRKTFANNVYMDLLTRVAAGEPLDALRGTAKALGHTDIKNTDRYLSFLTADIDRTISRVGV